MAHDVIRIRPEPEALEVAADELDALAEIQRLLSNSAREPLASQARRRGDQCVRVAAWLRSL